MVTLHDSYGNRTALGWALSLFALLTAAAAAALFVPATLWAMFSGMIVSPELRSPEYSRILAMLFACPLMLIVTAVVGFKSFFENFSGWTLAFTLLPMCFVVTVFAVDFGDVRFDAFPL